MGEKTVAELGFFCETVGCEVVPDSTGRDLSDLDPSPPGHFFEAGIGYSQGDAKLVGQFPLGDIGITLQLLQEL
jgi:hypothetical protein